MSDANLQTLLKSFITVFQNDLSDELSLKQKSEHIIETENAASVNFNTYPLSLIQLNKQIKQVSEFL